MQRFWDLEQTGVRTQTSRRELASMRPTVCTGTFLHSRYESRHCEGANTRVGDRLTPVQAKFEGSAVPGGLVEFFIPTMVQFNLCPSSLSLSLWPCPLLHH